MIIIYKNILYLYIDTETFEDKYLYYGYWLSMMGIYSSHFRKHIFFLQEIDKIKFKIFKYEICSMISAAKYKFYVFVKFRIPNVFFLSLRADFWYLNPQLIKLREDKRFKEGDYQICNISMNFLFFFMPVLDKEKKICVEKM